MSTAPPSPNPGALAQQLAALAGQRRATGLPTTPPRIDAETPLTKVGKFIWKHLITIRSAVKIIRLIIFSIAICAAPMIAIPAFFMFMLMEWTISLTLDGAQGRDSMGMIQEQVIGGLFDAAGIESDWLEIMLGTAATALRTVFWPTYSSVMNVDVASGSMQPDFPLFT
jgi:hypothetical protein